MTRPLIEWTTARPTVTSEPPRLRIIGPPSSSPSTSPLCPSNTLPNLLTRDLTPILDTFAPVGTRLESPLGLARQPPTHPVRSNRPLRSNFLRWHRSEARRHTFALDETLASRRLCPHDLTLELILFSLPLTMTRWLPTKPEAPTMTRPPLPTVLAPQMETSAPTILLVCGTEILRSARPTTADVPPVKAVRKFFRKWSVILRNGDPAIRMIAPKHPLLQQSDGIIIIWLIGAAIALPSVIPIGPLLVILRLLRANLDNIILPLEIGIVPNEKVRVLLVLGKESRMGDRAHSLIACSLLPIAQSILRRRPCVILATNCSDPNISILPLIPCPALKSFKLLKVVDLSTVLFPVLLPTSIEVAWAHIPGVYPRQRNVVLVYIMIDRIN